MVIGFVICAVGIIGLLSPQTYAQFGSFWEDAPALYLLAVIQLVVGLVLFSAAPRSRSPVGLGVLGAFALVEAILMPLMGPGRAHAIAHWWTSQSSSFLRLWGALELAVGILIVCAVAPSRRALPPTDRQPRAA
jgi:hypothetical protein